MERQRGQVPHVGKKRAEAALLQKLLLTEEGKSKFVVEVTRIPQGWSNESLLELVQKRIQARLVRRPLFCVPPQSVHLGLTRPRESGRSAPLERVGGGCSQGLLNGLGPANFPSQPCPVPRGVNLQSLAKFASQIQF